jgi:hypothetical protein
VLECRLPVSKESPTSEYQISYAKMDKRGYSRFIRAIREGQVRCGARQERVQWSRPSSIKPINAHSLIVQIRRVLISVKPRLKINRCSCKIPWIEDSRDAGVYIRKRPGSAERERQNRLHKLKLCLSRVGAIVDDGVVVTNGRILRTLSRTHSKEEEDSSEQHDELVINENDRHSVKIVRSGGKSYLLCKSSASCT